MFHFGGEQLAGRVCSATALAVTMGVSCTAVAQTRPADPGVRKALPTSVSQALKLAGTNRAELLAAWNQTPQVERAGMQFLLTNMPDQDLRTLKAAYLREQVSIAYQADQKAPWHSSVPRAIFFNDVLPYACMTERRDDSRAMLRAKSLPLIVGCSTLGEAAQQLNRRLFPLLRVRYSTGRKRPDQNPTETIASGIATCSGLSILLVDACRSVGIPARVVGTPLWANLTGNHTWVEIWDGTAWRFTGAAEPDPNGLDRGWFVANASQAVADVPQHAIYAGSFAKTGLAFPLVWARDVHWVPAVNVTNRYASTVSKPGGSSTRVLVKAVDENGRRVAAQITLREAGPNGATYSGVSKAGAADANDMLTFRLLRVCPPRQYELNVSWAGMSVVRTFTCGMNPEELITVRMDGEISSQTPLGGILVDRFGLDAARKEAARQELQSRRVTSEALAAAWSAYKHSPLHETLKQQWGSKTVSTPDRSSPYLWRYVGQKPANGWALVLAMHGGGNAPNAVNDREWQHMFSGYYNDHPEAGGYIYLALRAPNDTWNGFYDDAICPLIEALIAQFVLFADVDVDKVYTLGASHGGYGAFVIGPKIPFRFAAVHAAASAPTDGETHGENLRDVPFSIMTGALDNGYGRIDRDNRFMTEVALWRKQYGGYDIKLTSPAGVGHLVPDHDELASLLKFKRDPWPKKVVWTQSDSVIHRFYWLEAVKPVNGGHLVATVVGNTVTVTADNQESVALWLDSDLVDIARPVTVAVNGGRGVVYRLKPNLATYCDGLEMTGDPHLSAPVRIVVNVSKPPVEK